MRENTASGPEQTGAGALSCCVNRELSWLKFNERVMEEARERSNPMFERLNFAAIFQSNLDEFYMVRVGMLMDTLNDGVTDDKTGMTSAQQLSAVLDRTKVLLAERDRIYKELMRELGSYGVELCRFGSLPDKTQAFLEKYFMTDVLPLLSPQIVGHKQPFPFLRNKGIYAVAILRTKSSERIGIVPCAEGTLRRLVPLPGEGLRFVLLEELIVQFLPKILSTLRRGGGPDPAGAQRRHPGGRHRLQRGRDAPGGIPQEHGEADPPTDQAQPREAGIQGQAYRHRP